MMKRIFIKIITLSLVLLPFAVYETNSYYTSSTSIGTNKITLGCWITPSVPEPSDPPDNSLFSDESGWYENKLFEWEDSENLCPLDDGTKYELRLFSDSSGTTLLNTFENLNNSELLLTENLFDGNYSWKVRACGSVSQCSEWSDLYTFEIDTDSPDVDITKPSDNEELSGDEEIEGTIIDSNPSTYNLIIKNSSNEIVFELGETNMSSSLDPAQLLLVWDTTTVPDGMYKITLSAEDRVGNTGSDEINVNIQNSISEGDIVINEIMWMGTQKNPGEGDKEDQWIELRNMTSKTINISGYKIEKAGEGNSKIEISDGKVIPANGFFIIAAKNKENSFLNVTVNDVKSNMGLDDDGEVLTLKTPSGKVIDETPDGDWAAGDKTDTKKYSMERDFDPGDGTDADSWHTCNTDDPDHDCTSTDFWDESGLNYGTPGSANYSEEEKKTTDEKDEDGNDDKNDKDEKPNSESNLKSLTDGDSEITPTPDPTPAPTPDPVITEDNETEITTDDENQEDEESGDTTTDHQTEPAIKEDDSGDDEDETSDDGGGGDTDGNEDNGDGSEETEEVTQIHEDE